MNQTNSARPFYQHLLIGESSADVNYHYAGTFGNHWHSEMEILYVFQGSGSITVAVDNLEYILVPHSAIIISSSAVHAITAADPQCQVLYIKVGHALLGQDYSIFAGKRFHDPLICFDAHPDSQLRSLEPIFHQLINAVSDTPPEQDLPVRKLMINACLYQIAAILAQHMPMVPISSQRARQLESVMAVQTVLSHIENAYPHPITLEYAATLAGYEKTRFCQLFKQAVGVSFYKYLTDRRLQAAVSMLRETNLPISAIGEAVGILQPKTFSRLIRQNYGKTPSELRAEHTSKGV